MSAEPPLDRAALLGAVRERYGLTPDTAAFLPHGSAPAYRLDGPGGRWFAKLLPDTRSGQAAAELPLLRALRDRGVLDRVPRPLLTLGGAPITRLEGHSLIVYAWIEGRPLGDSWTAALGELAPLLGRLHAGTRAVLEAAPSLPFPPEDFALPFDGPLQRDLAHLRSGTDGRPGVQALAALLAPREAHLRHLLNDLRGAQRQALTRPPRLVLCHTDAHGGNVMRDDGGELWLIDWESARLAPPEHDLWMLHERLPEVLPAYWAASGDAQPPDVALLGFYLRRRVLEDIAVDVHAVLHEHTRPEQDAAALEVIRRFILPSLEQLEDTLARVQRDLSAP